MLVELGLNLFRCDDCGKEVLTKSFPKGWVWLKQTMTRRQTEHRCEVCKERAPKHEFGEQPKNVSEGRVLD